MRASAGYTNWDLSTDRANAARRALEGGGLETERISRVVGLASSVLFDKDESAQRRSTGASASS